MMAFFHFMNISFAMKYAIYNLFSEKLNRFYLYKRNNPHRKLENQNSRKTILISKIG